MSPRHRGDAPARRRIMGVLAELAEPATVAYIARWAQCSTTTVRILLRELDAAGSLVTDTSGGYPYRYMLKGTGLSEQARITGHSILREGTVLIEDTKAAGGQLSRFTPPELPSDLFGPVPERIKVTYLTMPREVP